MTKTVFKTNMYRIQPDTHLSEHKEELGQGVKMKQRRDSALRFNV